MEEEAVQFKKWKTEQAPERKKKKERVKRMAGNQMEQHH